MAGSNATATVPFPAHFFFTPQCYKKVVLDLDMLDGPCLQLLCSKLVGYTIFLIASLFVKGPQLRKILLAGSAEGVSFLSTLLLVVQGLAGLTYSIVKDFPFSTWGEGVALLLQNFAIGLLILLYNKQRAASLLYTVLCTIGLLALLSPIMPMVVHTTLQLMAVPLTASSRIWTNLRNGSTGQLSAVSIFMMLFRSGGRLFTSVTETSDPYRTAVYAIGTVLNLILAAQIVYYRNPKEKTSKIKTT